jgi:hypothetical protein
MIRSRFKLLLVIWLLGCSSAVFAQGGGSNDIDADSITDIFQTKVASSNNIQWYVRGSDDSTIVDKGIFGKKADVVLPLDWTGVPSLTKIVKSGDNLIWTAKRAVEGVAIGSFTFGKTSYSVVTGGDFDGSLIPDAVTVRPFGSKLKWSIKYDPLADGSAGETEEITFGSSSGQVSYLNLDGDGDWLVVASKNASGVGYSLRAKNPRTQEVRTISIGAESLRPEPIRSPEGSDGMAFIKRTANKTTVSFRESSGVVIRSDVEFNAPGSSDGQSVIGDFNISDPGEEIAVKTNNSLFIYNPFSDTTTTMSGIENTPVDSFFVGSFSGDNCGALQMPDGFAGNLWKPSSDTMYFAVFVASSKYTGKISKVSIYKASNNQKIKDLTYKGKGNPGLDGIDRQNYQDYSLTGSMYKNQYGSIRIQVSLNDGTCVSKILTDPAQRVD